MDLAMLAERTGQELGVSPWHAIGQDRIDRFADATDDHQGMTTENTVEIEGGDKPALIAVSLVTILPG
jgi:hypothetical protein